MGVTVKVLAAIADNVAEQKRIENERIDLIARARVMGINWEAIAEALGGLTRQAVHRKYSTKVKARVTELVEQVLQ